MNLKEPHYHLIMKLTLEEVKILRRLIPIIHDKKFHMTIALEPNTNDDELEDALFHYLLRCIILIEKANQIQ